MADRVVVQANKVSRGGFADAAPWRKAVPDIYNRYVLCAADANYDVAFENAEALFRPLFITSYTAIDFLREHAFFGAKQIVVSSASSKTAYGAAWCLAKENIPLIALRAIATGPLSRGWASISWFEAIMRSRPCRTASRPSISTSPATPNCGDGFTPTSART